MLSTAKLSNVGFSQVVQLFAPPTNPAMHLTQTIPLLIPKKIILGVNNVHTNISI